MHLKSVKPKIKHLLCIVTLLTLTFVKAQAQEDEPPSHNQPESDPYPQNNSPSCSGNSPYLCPITKANPTTPTPSPTNLHLFTVYDANELYDLLSCLYQDWIVNDPSILDPFTCYPNKQPGDFCTNNIIPSCTNPITIQIAPGHDIDFNDLRDGAGNKMPHVFPLEVPPGVSIVGDYDISNVMPDGRSYGTRIIFPFLYEGGKEPGIPQSEWYEGYSASCNMDGAFVFKLNDGAKILNVCMQGPQPYAADIRWKTGYRDSCKWPPAYIDPVEGMVGGILVFGNNCEVAYNEIFGFPHSGILVSDIVQAAGPLHITPPACFDYGNDSRGRLDVHHNYIHNCKSQGYGYGIYVGYKGLAYNTANPYCNTTATTGYWNYEAPEEEVFINNNIFFDNKCDIDGSGGRLGLYITQNTFGARDILENIHFHNSGGKPENKTCNPMAGVIVANCPISLQPNNFDDIGLNYLEISNNTFYQLGLNLNLVYPNLNPTPAGSYNFLQPNLNIFGNYFAIQTYVAEGAFAQTSGGTNLDWLWATCRSGLDGHNKIMLRDGLYHYDYLYKITAHNPNFGDPNITIDEVADNPANVCATVPFDENSETPVATITSVTDADLDAGILPNAENKYINQHETVWFSSEASYDKDRNLPENSSHSMINLWRFNNEEKELATEKRTNNSAPLVPQTFDEVGITRVNLTTIDLSPTAFNHWRASNVTSQRITVKPITTNVTWLSFWIYDTYVGRLLQPVIASSCTTCTHGYDDVTQAGAFIDPNPTGFRKFARISPDGGNSWNYIWVDDIEGDEGWQHIIIPIANPADPDPDYTEGILEIGIESYFPVEATVVRGVSVFIDDVYINSEAFDNLNAIANGDFEEHADPDILNHPDVWHYPLNPHGKFWDEYNWPLGNASPFSANCLGFITAYNGKGMSLTTEQVHSGMWSYEAYIRPINGSTYSPGVHYAANQVYKSIQQPFNVNAPPPSQRSSHIPVFSFAVQPNPSNSNNQIKLLQTSSTTGTSYFELYNSQGNLILKDQFAGNQYSFNSPIAPGIYVAKLINNNSMSYQKVLVTH